MPRLTLKSLVVEDLGYCCVWFFLTRFRRSRVVADRLGLDIRTVNYARKRVKDGTEVCSQCDRCMHRLVKMDGDARKIPIKPQDTTT